MARTKKTEDDIKYEQNAQLAEGCCLPKKVLVIST